MLRPRPWLALAALLGPVAAARADAGDSGDAAGTPAPKPPAPRVEIVRTEAAIRIDGVLDEPAWADASVVADFVQIDPDEGAAPTERTEVRVMHDGRRLLVGIRCFDDEPDRILAREMRRDVRPAADDRVAFVVDGRGDRRNGYFFELGAGGAKVDALVEENRTLREDWDGIWEGRTVVDALGWTAEFAIPFATVSFDAGVETWGFNVERTIRRKRELVRWSGASRNVGITSIADAGELAGMHDLERGLGVTVVPFGVGRFDSDRGDVDLDAGGDVFLRFTPTTTLAFTFNTDFAETEADARRINLTRFPLFFPEKRDFFLEDAGIFAFGGIRQSPLPFFSRRIGIGPDGRPRDILAGARLTGREGGVNFGLLDVQMKDDDELGAKNLAVGRVSLNVLEESTVGLIGTYGDPGRPDEGALLGTDFNFRTSDLPGGEVLDANAWVQATETGGRDDSDPIAFGGRIGMPNDRVSWSLFAAQIGSDYRPALGFVQRPGVREFDGSWRHRWRPGGGIRTIDLSTRAGTFTDLSGDLLTGNATLPELTVTAESGDSAFAGVRAAWDHTNEAFPIFDGVTIAADKYEWLRGFVGGGTDAGRPFAANARVEAGEFFAGHRTDVTVGGTWRPGPGFSTNVEYEWNGVDLPEGTFDVHIVRTRVEWQFSPTLAWSTLLQYDNVSDLAGVNSRVRWEIEPGRELFLVVNHAADANDGWRTDSSIVVVKVKWSMRF